MASKYLQKHPLPQGFREILHDFAKEILRDQPRDIVHYAALYFKAQEMGMEFDYPDKGESIPPPKLRQHGGTTEGTSGIDSLRGEPYVRTEGEETEEDMGTGSGGYASYPRSGRPEQAEEYIPQVDTSHSQGGDISFLAARESAGEYVEQLIDEHPYVERELEEDPDME